MLTKHRQISDNKYNFYWLLFEKFSNMHPFFKSQGKVLINFLRYFNDLPSNFFEYNKLPNIFFILAVLAKGGRKTYYVENFNNTVCIEIALDWVIQIRFFNTDYHHRSYEVVSIESIINWIKENAHKT